MSGTRISLTQGKVAITGLSGSIINVSDATTHSILGTIFSELQLIENHLSVDGIFLEAQGIHTDTTQIIALLSSANSFGQGDSPAIPGVPIPPGPGLLTVTPPFPPSHWIVANDDVVDISLSIDGGVTFQNLKRGQSATFDNRGFANVVLQSQGGGGEEYKVFAW